MSVTHWRYDVGRRCDAHWNGSDRCCRTWPEHHRRDRIISTPSDHSADIHPALMRRRFPNTTSTCLRECRSRSLLTTLSQDRPLRKCSTVASCWNCWTEQDNDDDSDGIFCKTRKGQYEINLPLIELEIPQDSPNFQLIEDYWSWFWNWR